MTWISARRSAPRPRKVGGASGRQGRPPIRAHVVAVWAVCPWTQHLEPCWHVKRTLVSTFGEVAKLCTLMLELDHPTAKPDWKSRALRKRLKREGFREVVIVDPDSLSRELVRRNGPALKEVSAQNPPDWLTD